MLGTVILELEKTEAWPVASIPTKKLDHIMTALEKLDFCLPGQVHIAGCRQHSSSITPKVPAFLTQLKGPCSSSREKILSTRFDEAAFPSG